jgi:dCMP deaminase
VVIFSDYHDTLAESFFADSGIVLDIRPMPSCQISYDLSAYTSARKNTRK